MPLPELLAGLRERAHIEVDDQLAAKFGFESAESFLEGALGDTVALVYSSDGVAVTPSQVWRDSCNPFVPRGSREYRGLHGGGRGGPGAAGGGGGGGPGGGPAGPGAGAAGGGDGAEAPAAANGTAGPGGAAVAPGGLTSFNSAPQPAGSAVGGVSPVPQPATQPFAAGNGAMVAARAQSLPVPAKQQKPAKGPGPGPAAAGAGSKSSSGSGGKGGGGTAAAGFPIGMPPIIPPSRAAPLPITGAGGGAGGAGAGGGAPPVPVHREWVPGDFDGVMVQLCEWRATAARAAGATCPTPLNTTCWQATAFNGPKVSHRYLPAVSRRRHCQLLWAVYSRFWRCGARRVSGHLATVTSPQLPCARKRT